MTDGTITHTCSRGCHPGARWHEPTTDGTSATSSTARHAATRATAPHDTSHSLGEHETGDVALTPTASIIADVLLLAQTRGQDVAAILALATVYVADSRANHDAAYALTPDAATALVDTLHPDTVTHAPHPDAADLAEATADIYATD